MSWLSKKDVSKMREEDEKEEKAKLEGVEYARPPQFPKVSPRKPAQQSSRATNGGNRIRIE